MEISRKRLKTIIKEELERFTEADTIEAKNFSLKALEAYEALIALDPNDQTEFENVVAAAQSHLALTNASAPQTQPTPGTE